MATEVEKLVIELQARTRQYEQALARAEGTTVSRMRGIERQMQASARRQQAIFSRMGVGLQRTLTASLAPLAAFASLAGVQRLTAELSELGKQAKRTGLDAETLQARIRSATLAGASGNTLVQAMERMSLSIGEGVTKSNDLSRILKANNIDIAEFAALVPRV